MSKKNILILCLVILFAGIALRFVYTRTILWVEQEIYVQERPVHAYFNQIENQYQRRIDLIKYLASCSKVYAKNPNVDIEMQALSVTADSLAGIIIDPYDLTSLHQYAAAQNKLFKRSCTSINMVEDLYPELKSDTIFKSCYKQLIETKSCILNEQNLYNKEIKMYNAKINKFPFCLLRNKEFQMWTTCFND